MADDKPIIIIKKKGGHGGHHGGAWKVAYADFVTAMMAFFMVMWLLNSSESKTRQAIASYFRRPGLFESGSGTPLLIGGAGILSDAYAPPKPYEEASQVSGSDTASGAGKGKEGKEKGPFVSPKTDQDLKSDGVVISDEIHQGVVVEKEKQGGAAEFVEKLKAQKKKMEEIAKELESAMQEAPELKELLGLVEMSVTADGLTIEIMDTDNASMFRSGSAQILPDAASAFDKIATLLKPLPNQIEIMGHTDAKPFSRRGGVSNWELSSDRANAARRLLEQQGIPPERIVSVIGRADRALRYPEEPFRPSNRRISLKVKFDMEKMKSESSKNREAFQEFSKFFDPEGSATRGPSPEDGSGAPLNVEKSPSSASPAPQASAETGAAEPVKKKKEDSGGYKPQIEIRGADAKRGTILPPEEKPNDSSSRQQEPTIFKNDPVIGPNNPVFGF